MKLPNAPLIEVVFELRWALEGSKDVPAPLRHDPAFSLLAYDFAEKAKSYGYAVRREMAPSPAGFLGHSIQYRFLQSENTPFPIWQIGPGIFAYNESTDYEWSSYRVSLRNALQALLSSYPKTKASKLRPVHLELKYTDSFSAELLGHTDIEKFLSEDVKFLMKPNDFLKSNSFLKPIQGRVEIIRTVKKDKKSIFYVEIGTGTENNIPAIVMNSKVVKQSDDIALGDNNRAILSNAIKWADAAHEMTHEFFVDFVGDTLMRKFSG